jgi:ketosteroid isomerase-like protein
MQQRAKDLDRKLVPRVVILALGLVALIWAIHYSSAEARMCRATARVVRLVEKSGEESPVSLGLAANRLGGFLSAPAVLELADAGPLATGRPEIVQLFAQIRSSLETIAFEQPEIGAVAAGKGTVDVHVAARYRLVPTGSAAAEGRGTAELRWRKGKDGWQISRAKLTPAEGTHLPQGWQ